MATVTLRYLTLNRTGAFAELKAMFLEESDWKHDPWGAVNEWLFSIADSLYHMGGRTYEYVPDEWQYRHAPYSTNADCRADNPLREQIDKFNRCYLVEFAEILMRFKEMLRANGKDY